MEGITYIPDFLPRTADLFTFLNQNAAWDSSMAARKTASYGLAYNYAQISYPYREFLEELKTIAASIQPAIGFEPNNCLINYYPDGKSKMGFHSDQTEMLATGTGIAILSLGATRILRFRNINHKEEITDFPLVDGSLLYMTQQSQREWQHAIPASDTQQARMSLTFRKIELRESMFTTAETEALINKQLQLPATGREQDWAIEMADAKRTEEFIAASKESGLSAELRYAFMELILASYDDYLSETGASDHIVWNHIKEVLNNDKPLYKTLLYYWAQYTDRAGSDDTFAITPIIRKYLNIA